MQSTLAPLLAGPSVRSSACCLRMLSCQECSLLRRLFRGLGGRPSVTSRCCIHLRHTDAVAALAAPLARTEGARYMTEIKPVLEPAAQQFADANANPPQLYDLPVDKGRKIVDSVQDGDIPAPPVAITDLMIDGGPSGQVSIKMFRPQGASGVLPVLLFTHGAGWVFGDAHTHGRLVAELATRAGAAAVFTNYSLSPEAKYPTALEEIYSVLEWIAGHGAEQQLDPSRIAVSGDSVGGNMTTAITIMAKQRGG